VNRGIHRERGADAAAEKTIAAEDQNRVHGSW
jgi:hypothetical protein